MQVTGLAAGVLVPNTTANHGSTSQSCFGTTKINTPLHTGDFNVATDYIAWVFINFDTPMYTYRTTVTLTHTFHNVISGSQ